MRIARRAIWLRRYRVERRFRLGKRRLRARRRGSSTRIAYIEGHVDFIFGDAKAAFKNCEIHALAHSMDTLTAQSKVYPAEDSGYLFLDCTVTGEEGATNILLGRPWRTYSTAVFVNTDFKARLNPAGWQEWGGKIPTSFYAEYKSHGEAGDVSQRLAGTHVLTDEEAKKYTVKDWLSGKDGWDPTKVK